MDTNIKACDKIIPQQICADDLNLMQWTNLVLQHDSHTTESLQAGIAGTQISKMNSLQHSICILIIRENQNQFESNFVVIGNRF